MGNTLEGSLHRDIKPIPFTEPKFDPQFGFEKQRKERVSPVTEDQLQAARIDKEFRDYCAHYYLKILECQRRNYPFMWKCAHERHEHAQCEFDDYVMRLKEFERERRLLAREQRKMNAEAAVNNAAAAQA